MTQTLNVLSGHHTVLGEKGYNAEERKEQEGKKRRRNREP